MRLPELKLSFRVTLMTILLSLLVGTVSGLGGASYLNARKAAAELSRQILDQTALRIDQEINNDCIDVSNMVSVNARLLQSEIVKSDRFGTLMGYWQEVMQAYPDFASVQLGLESNGEWYYVRRVPSGKLRLGELKHLVADKPLQLREYEPGDYPTRPLPVRKDMPPLDARDRPWYRAARTANREVWTEVYLLPNLDGQPGIPGVSCAAPVKQADGSLLGVLGVSFDVYDLCGFLKSLQIGENGFAFVVECRGDGSLSVIGHPDSSLILRAAPADVTGPRFELVTPDEIADVRVRAFLDSIPGAMHPRNIPGLQEVRFQTAGTRYLGAYSRLSTNKTPDWMIAIVLPESDVLGQVEAHNRETVIIGAIVVLLGVLLTIVVSNRIGHTLECLQKETEAVGQFRIEARPPIHSEVSELDRFGIAVEEMKAGLRSFQKYVPADLVRNMLADGKEAELGGERRTLTILFSDIANFTTTAETLSPEALVEHLGEFLSALSQGIESTGGTVDKYIGDAIMAFWGAPAPNPNHAVGACRAALANQKRLAGLRQEWTGLGKPAFHARVGICTGDVIVGNIGSPTRMNYTVIGDSVNVASRLESLNKVYGTSILLSDTTYREAECHIVARPIDWVSVKGKTTSLLVYELLGLKAEVDPKLQDLSEACARALACYRSQDWGSAVAILEQVLQSWPNDAPAQVMLRRCRAYHVAPPDTNWDGVTRLETK